MAEHFQITKKQHFVAARHVDRFGAEGVFVHLKLEQNRTIESRLSPRNDIFVCRAWDHRTEARMTAIERRFHHEVDNALSRGDLLIRDHNAVAEYMLMWATRDHLRRVETSIDLGLVSGPSIGAQAKQILEFRGASFVGEDGRVESRFLGSSLLTYVQDFIGPIDAMRFKVVRAPRGLEFVCPDAISTGLGCYSRSLAIHPFIPISPTILVVRAENARRIANGGEIDRQLVRELNQTFLNNSIKLIFAASREVLANTLDRASA